MDNNILSWILAFSGMLGFILAGRKIWWAWYFNLVTQIIWFYYGWTSEQWGFVVSAIIYAFIFLDNALRWTKEHKADKPIRNLEKNIGQKFTPAQLQIMREAISKHPPTS